MIAENGRIKVYSVEGHDSIAGMIFQRLYSSVALAEKALSELKCKENYWTSYSIKAILLDGSLSDHTGSVNKGQQM
jgi:hypothetical protein